MANKNTKHRNRTKPVARPNADGVISHNKARNSCMRVYVNRGENQQSQSLTAHEPWLKHEPMRFPNHGYMEYRRPGALQVSA
jgi:hypothetical protein